MEFRMFSDKGDREINEDFVGMTERDNCFLFALADGLGGHGKGEVASSLVVSTVMHYYMEQDIRPSLSACIEYAQRMLIKQQELQHESDGMRTTLVLLEVAEGEAHWAHVGDSRLYLFQNHRVKLRTLDHSVPQMLVAMGEIKEKDIRGHEDRNRLLKVMGMEWTKPLYEVSDSIPVDDNSAFLLCSDGFWEQISEKEMQKAMRHAVSVDAWLENMCLIARKNGAGKDMDNFSAVAVMPG